jgi:hypothetical protein
MEKVSRVLVRLGVSAVVREAPAAAAPEAGAADGLGVVIGCHPCGRWVEVGVGGEAWREPQQPAEMARLMASKSIRSENIRAGPHGEAGCGSR